MKSRKLSIKQDRTFRMASSVTPPLTFAPGKPVSEPASETNGDQRDPRHNDHRGEYVPQDLWRIRTSQNPSSGSANPPRFPSSGLDTDDDVDDSDFDANLYADDASYLTESDDDLSNWKDLGREEELMETGSEGNLGSELESDYEASDYEAPDMNDHDNPSPSTQTRSHSVTPLKCEYKGTV
jgi:hypothetical protein